MSTPIDTLFGGWMTPYFRYRSKAVAEKDAALKEKDAEIRALNSSVAICFNCLRKQKF